jgi:hypothetical protein
VHTSNISSCQKNLFSFPVAVNNSIKVGPLVINVCNHGGHYETPVYTRVCIYIYIYIYKPNILCCDIECVYFPFIMICYVSGWNLFLRTKDLTSKIALCCPAVWIHDRSCRFFLHSKNFTVSKKGLAKQQISYLVLKQPWNQIANSECQQRHF